MSLLDLIGRWFRRRQDREDAADVESDRSDEALDAHRISHDDAEIRGDAMVAHRAAAEEAMRRGVAVTVEVVDGKVTNVIEHQPTVADVEHGFATVDEFLDEAPPEPKPKKKRAPRKSAAVALAADEKKSKAREKKKPA